MSIHATMNAFWDLPCCDMKHGIYGMCPPDLLHQYKLGILKYLVSWSMEYVQECNVSKINLLDERIRRFNTACSWHSFQIIKFNKGIIDQSFFEGKHYLSMIYMLMVSVGFKEKFIPDAEKRKQFHQCLYNALCLWFMLNKRSYNAV